MNEKTAALLLDVTQRLERSIVAHDCPAVVLLDGERRLALSDYDYLRDDQTAGAFETRAARKARELGVTRWVLAVPQVWAVTAESVAMRAVSNHPLREGEQEAITWMTFDGEDGVDYGRVAYTRRPNGEPVFGEPEMFTVGVRPSAIMPGYVLLQEFLPQGE
ncbi:hypothetical protein [Sphaerisporangium sp. TRM90804]|uniref:hypothetical protein n=1 Tax=Sphaerisporangium sp. TRM90804 TaxID=3031113 RepID=UPI00244A2E97|nr:hypothetical protein [Sphaerisporangium sp. TRM90804]MDH2426466.1 hypothetical protein [Sphaerisporangium sp. TRM90804]